MDLYVIFYRYNHGEYYEVYWVGDNLEQGKTKYLEECKSFFKSGPDDLSQLWFEHFYNLTQKEVNWLRSLVGLTGSKFSERDQLRFNKMFGSGWERNPRYIKNDVSVVYGDDFDDDISEFADDYLTEYLKDMIDFND